LLSPACASFDMFDDFEHRGDAFKRIIKDVIAKLHPCQLRYWQH
jgi:UDP-N-acetylmuramoylalanine-D-glutamate ligase